MDRIKELRDALSHGQGVNQSQLDDVQRELQSQKARLRPNDKDELLPLFDSNGNLIGTKAPRWMCHTLALRHLCTHILLIWRSSSMGDTLVLQIRSWDKDDSPGHLDISVAGHMTSKDNSSRETAFLEMAQEANLEADDLIDRKVHYIDGYSYDEEPRPNDSFFNSEWRVVYIAYVNDDGFKKIKFSDGEIAGIVLLPLKDAYRLMGQGTMPMGNALTQSLPICLRKM